MVDQEKELSSVRGTEKKKRRPLTAETKYAIFLEAGRGDVPVAEVLRKHGIHSSELQRIREKIRRGALKELGGKSKASVNHPNDEELRRLQAEKERMEKALLELTIEHQLLKKRRAEIAGADRTAGARGRG